MQCRKQDALAQMSMKLISVCIVFTKHKQYNGDATRLESARVCLSGQVYVEHMYSTSTRRLGAALTHSTVMFNLAVKERAVSQLYVIVVNRRMEWHVTMTAC